MEQLCEGPGYVSLAGNVLHMRYGICRSGSVLGRASSDARIRQYDYYDTRIERSSYFYTILIPLTM